MCDGVEVVFFFEGDGGGGDGRTHLMEHEYILISMALIKSRFTELFAGSTVSA